MSKSHFVAAAILLAAASMTAEQRRDGSSQSPEVQLKAAINRETVDGDLRASIKEYQAIVDRCEKSNRPVAAAALLRMAGAYQRLGDSQSRAIYERIVRQFGDQEAATEAGTKLLALGDRAGTVSSRATNPAASRSIWSGPRVGIFGGGRVSRDARWLPYTDWSTGNLALHDLVNGTDRDLTDMGRFTSLRDQQYAGYSRVSPDSKQVAFGWFNSERYEIRVVDLHSNALNRSRILLSSPEADYVQPFDWSPDGKSIVVQLRRPDRSGQIALLDVATGSLTPLKTFDWRDDSTNAAFSPDGRYLAYDLPADDAPGERDVFALAVDGSRETRITAHRKNDQFVGWSSNGSRVIFSSDRTGTVQLWAQEMSGLDLRGSPHIIASDFSGHAVGLSGETIYDVKTTHSSSPFRTVGFDFVNSRVAATPVDPGEEFFSINLVAHAEWSPDGRFLALIRRDRGGPIGMLMSIVDLEGRAVRDVRPQLNLLGDRFAWDRSGQAIIAAGSDLKGRLGLFRLALDSGAATRLFGDEFPLGAGVALSPSGDEIYFRRVTASTIALAAKDLRSGAERELAMQSTPGPGLRPYLSPDGRRIVTVARTPTSEDVIIAIDVESAKTVELIRGPASSLTVLMWAPDSRTVFIRRSGEGGDPEVLRISVDGGDHVKVNWTLGHDNREFRLHPDGNRLVFVVNNVKAQSEVRALTNVLASPTRQKH